MASEKFCWFAFNEHKGWTAIIAATVLVVVVLTLLLILVGSLIWQRQFRFSVRSLFVLLVAVAAVCSWLAVKIKAAREQARAVQLLGESALVTYDCHMLPDGRIDAESKWPAAGCVEMLLGRDYFATVIGVMFMSGSDAELAYLKGLPDVRIVDLSYRRDVTDGGMQYLSGLAQLRTLGIGCTQVTDVGLMQLEGLARLESLYLCDDHVTDTVLEHVGRMTRLKKLYLDGTHVTVEGVARLQAKLPECEVFWNRLPASPRSGAESRANPEL